MYLAIPKPTFCVKYIHTFSGYVAKVIQKYLRAVDSGLRGFWQKKKKKRENWIFQTGECQKFQKSECRQGGHGRNKSRRSSETMKAYANGSIWRQYFFDTTYLHWGSEVFN